jgi:hypothetical protein
MNEHLRERFDGGPTGRSKKRPHQQQQQQQYDVCGDQVEVTFLPPRLNPRIVEYEDQYKTDKHDQEWLNALEVPTSAELTSDGPRGLPCNRLTGAWSSKG